MDLRAPVKSGPARERPNTAAHCLAAPGVASGAPGPDPPPVGQPASAAWPAPLACVHHARMHQHGNRRGAQPRTPAPGRRACHSERQALPSFAAACHKEIPLNEIEIRRRRTPVREPHEQSVQLEATARARRIVMQVSTRGCSTVTGNRRKLRPRTLAKVNWLLLCRRLPARSASGPGRPGPKP